MSTMEAPPILAWIVRPRPERNVRQGLDRTAAL